MINLRYHVVSLVAVFLALAIGIAMGSTVISKATVADLRTRINNAEQGIDDTNKVNGLLGQQLTSLKNTNKVAIEKLVPTVVAGRLDEVSVVVVAMPGLDQAYLQQTEATLSAAGADVRATVTINDRLSGIDTDDTNRTKLADLVAANYKNPAALTSVKLWQLAAAKLGAELRATTAAPVVVPPPTTTVPGTPPASTTVPATAAPPTAAPTTTVAPEPPLLSGLQEAGFVDVEADGKPADVADLLAGRGVRLVFLGEPLAAPTPGKPTGLGPQFLVPLLRAITKSGAAPVLVGSYADPGPAKADTPDAVREWFLAPIHDDKSLDGRLTTINDLEAVEGQIALVLSLVDVGDGQHGRYGTGSGATALAPSGG